MVKNIIFDFDGTLVDSSKAVDILYEHLRKKYNIQNITRDEFEKLKNLPIKDRFKKVGIPLYKIPLMSRDAKKIYKQLIDVVRPVEGIKELLDRLYGKDMALSIVSSNSHNNINQFLNNYEMNVFNSIYSTSSLFKKDKTLIKLMKEHGLQKEQVVYIGDELRDINACKKIPIKVIAVSWGYDSVSLMEKANPDYIVSEPMELFDIICKL